MTFRYYLRRKKDGRYSDGCGGTTSGPNELAEFFHTHHEAQAVCNGSVDEWEVVEIQHLGFADLV